MFYLDALVSHSASKKLSSSKLKTKEGTAMKISSEKMKSKLKTKEYLTPLSSFIKLASKQVPGKGKLVEQRRVETLITSLLPLSGESSTSNLVNFYREKIPSYVSSSLCLSSSNAYFLVFQ